MNEATLQSVASPAVAGNAPGPAWLTVAEAVDRLQPEALVRIMCAGRLDGGAWRVSAEHVNALHFELLQYFKPVKLALTSGEPTRHTFTLQQAACGLPAGTEVAFEHPLGGELEGITRYGLGVVLLLSGGLTVMQANEAGVVPGEELLGEVTAYRMPGE